MSLERTIQKIHTEINDLKRSLDLFFEDGIHPSVSDCEYMQQKLSLLQETLAVYKYQEQQHELSPSFNLHARISEKEAAPEEKQMPLDEPGRKKADPPAEKPLHVPPPPVQPARQEEKPAAEKPHARLAINLNDKFRFINELFAQNSAEYNIALEQLNNLKNWSDTEIYLSSLRNLYDWNENKDIVSYFYKLVKKRFE